MSGLVLFLALVSCLQMTKAVPCDYATGLIEPYLSNKTALYCFDDDDDDVVHEVTEFSKLCSTGDFSPRSDGMDTRCGAGYTHVGYHFYECNTDNGELGGEITSAGLTPYSACIPDANIANVCLDVTVANSVSKLSVDDVYEIDNIDLVVEANEDTIHYQMTCDEGFDFHGDVIKPVNGHCSGNTDGNNEYMLSDGDGCYELCDADNTDMEGVSLNHEGGSRSGEKIDTEVICPDGFDIAHDSPALWEFTCNGLKEGTANGGQYSCGDTCPDCIPQCPSGTFEFPEIVDGSMVIADAAASGQTVVATVQCDDGFGLAVGAELSYDVLCNTNENTTEANSGFWTVVNDLPVCMPTCPIETHASIPFVDTVIFSGDAGVEGSTKEGIVSCDSGYALGQDAGYSYSFTCTEGQYVADGKGPVCLQECNLPAQETDDLLFFYDGESLAVNGAVSPGRHVVDVACANETLKLVGPTTMSCRDGEVTFDGPEAPFCADTIICEAPNVINGETDTLANVEVGGVYTVMCNPSHWFDTKTVKEMNPGSATAEAYSATVVECTGEPIRDFECYFGCLAPDFAGATFPDMAEEGAAPYEMGAVVNFECLDGEGIEEGGAEATCEVGGIGAPVCGSCTFTLSLLLLAFTLLSLL